MTGLPATWFRLATSGEPFRVHVFKSSLAPDTAQLSTLRHRLSGWLEGAGVADPPRADVVLATHEAAANAINHSGGRAAVEIEANVEDRTVTVEIRDHGRWKPQAPPSIERGRGLCMIRALVTQVEIDTGEGGTTVRLVQRPKAASCVSGADSGKQEA